MTGLQGMDPSLIRQYSGAYGPFVPGDYAIGDEVNTTARSGVVIWSYQSQKGLVYVIDNSSGFPEEVPARRVVSE